MEMGFAVIGGNLPLLKPLFERFFRLRNGNTTKSNSNSFTHGPQSQAQITSRSKVFSSSKNVDADGFERISDDMSDGRTNPNSVRDIELGDRTILVKKDVTVVKE